MISIPRLNSRPVTPSRTKPEPHHRFIASPPREPAANSSPYSTPPIRANTLAVFARRHALPRGLCRCLRNVVIRGLGLLRTLTNISGADRAWVRPADCGSALVPTCDKFPIASRTPPTSAACSAASRILLGLAPPLFCAPAIGQDDSPNRGKNVLQS